MALEKINVVLMSNDEELFKYYFQYFQALETELGAANNNAFGIILDDPNPLFIQAIEDINKYISQFAELEAEIPNNKIKPFAFELNYIIQNDPNYKSKMFQVEEIPKALKDYFIVKISDKGTLRIEYLVKQYIKDYYAKYKNNEPLEDYGQFLELLNIMTCD